MSYTPFSDPTVGRDAGARTRVSQLTTLFDGKLLNADDTNLFDEKKTGTSTYSNSIQQMSVTAGQYVIRQGRFFCPYFSGKSQVVEITFDTFANDANTVKRAGYFSSNAVAPYDADYDGFWIEATGTTYKLVIKNFGTTVLDLDWTSWDGYSQLSSYNWDNFTVVLFDFLWLGGAILRMFVKTSTGFVLAHTFNFAGSASGVFLRSPQQPIRYEIRSTTGTGAFNVICSQVSSEGSVSEQSHSQSIYNSAAIACNTVGTIYALKGVRLSATYRNEAAWVESYGGVIVSSASDAGILMLLLNPTLSAPLTYAASGRIEQATATTQTITAGTGIVVDAVGVLDSGISHEFPQNVLAQMPCGIDNTMGELVLAYQPLTTNQNVAGTLTIQRY